MNLIKLTGRDKHHLVQLCLPIEKSKGKLAFPVLASEKLDGVYGLIVEDKNNQVHIFSRTGEEYLSLEHIKCEAQCLFNNSSVSVLIAELYVPGVDQPTISGWCRDTKHQHPEVQAHVHDALNMEEFVSGFASVPFETRSMYLRRRADVCEHCIEFKHLFIIPQKMIFNQADLMTYAQTIWDKGGEGLVAIPTIAPYQAGKRNANMVKIKEGVSFDLRVVMVQEGKGKYEHMVGNLVCQDAKGKMVNVGSGLSDSERKAWYKKPEAIIGKIVVVSAMAVSTKGVLREPRFKGIRYDKQQEDTIC